MKGANKVVSNTGILYARMAVTIFISLYTTRIILKSLGSADFGIFSVVGGVIAMLGFLNASMASATQRFMSYAEGSNNQERQIAIFNVSVVLHFAIALIMGLVMSIVGYFFFNGILNIPANRISAAEYIYVFMIVSTMLTIMTVPYDAVLNAHENMLFYSIVGVLESILKLVAAFLIVGYTGDKLIRYGFLMASISLILIIIMRSYCHYRYKECVLAPRKYFNKSLMKEMTGFAGWNFLTAAVTMISTYGMGIILNIFFGTKINAAQGIANQVSGQLSSFSKNMMKALAPSITKSEGAGSRESMLKISSIGAKASFILSLLFMGPFIVEAPFVLKLWLGSVPLYTVIFCRLLLIQILFESFTNVLGQSLMAEGNIANSTKARAIHNVFYLPIICALFYFGYSAEYMYYAMIVKTIIGIAIVLYYNKVQCGLNMLNYSKDVLVPCFATLILVLGSLFGIAPLMDEGIMKVVMITLLSTVITLTLSYTLILNLSERDMIIRVKNSFLSKIRPRTIQV